MLISYYGRERFFFGDSTQFSNSVLWKTEEKKLYIIIVQQKHILNKIPEISHVILCFAIPNKYSLEFWGIVEESPMKIEVQICWFCFFVFSSKNIIWSNQCKSNTWHKCIWKAKHEPVYFLVGALSKPRSSCHSGIKSFHKSKHSNTVYQTRKAETFFYSDSFHSSVKLLCFS